VWTLWCLTPVKRNDALIFRSYGRSKQAALDAKTGKKAGPLRSRQSKE
jgi:hypothetical protein